MMLAVNRTLQRLPSLALTVCNDYRSPERPQEAGGDVVAVSEHADGSTALLVGDVSAKGGEGDAFAAWMATVFHIAATCLTQPAQILEQVNRRMCDAFGDPSRGLFASAFVCRCFPAQRACTYASAGAEPPIVFNDASRPRYLLGNGIVLGIERGARYDDFAETLSRDDAMVVYTDGVTDSQRYPTMQRLGTAGLAEALCRAVHEAGIPTSHDVLSAVDRLNGGHYHDDASLVVIRLPGTFSHSHRATVEDRLTA